MTAIEFVVWVVATAPLWLLGLVIALVRFGESVPTTIPCECCGKRFFVKPYPEDYKCPKCEKQDKP